MTPQERKHLVRSWRRFVDRIEEKWESEDDTSDVVTVGEVINDVGPLTRLIRARGQYLKALEAAGLISSDQQVPDDHRLWEMHPANITGPDDWYEDGAVLIAGVLYDKETLEEVAR